MEGHRPLTQYVQPMDLKGFLTQYLKHLLNVIKPISPFEALNGNVTGNLDLQFSLLTKYVDLSRVVSHLATILFSDASEMILADVTINETADFKRKAERVLHGECDGRWNQQRPDKVMVVIAMLSYSMRPQQIPPGSWLQKGRSCGVIVPPCPNEYNHMNQGWVAEQSNSRGNERCLSSCGYCAPDQDRGINTVWTNPRSHTNQTLKSSKQRNIIQQRKDAKKKRLNYCNAFESERPRK